MCNTKSRIENPFKATIERFNTNVYFLYIYFYSRLNLIENKKWPEAVPDKSIKTLPIIKIMSKQLKTKDGLAAVGFFTSDCNYNLD